MNDAAVTLPPQVLVFAMKTFIIISMISSLISKSLPWGTLKLKILAWVFYLFYLFHVWKKAKLTKGGHSFYDNILSLEALF